MNISPPARGVGTGLTAVAWDVDGTLVDSEPLHHRALVLASAGFGADLSDLSEQAFRGIHMHDVWAALRPRLPPSLGEAEWLAAIEDRYVAERGALVAMPAAVATVRALAARGVPQACVSNSGRRVVDANLDALGLTGLMAFSISLDDVVAGKPDPEPYRAACRRLGLPPAAVVAVEDSAAGAAAARAAGLFTVGYLPAGGGFGAVDAVIDDLGHVAALFDR